MRQTIKDLEFNFIELPKFQTPEQELAGVLEQWIYFIKHADDLTMIPDALAATPEIVAAFEVAEQHNWTQEELDVYDYWQMQEAGHKDALETAKRDGRLEGKLEGKLEGRQEGEVEGKMKEKREIAQKMLAAGIDRTTISQVTGLSQADIEQFGGDQDDSKSTR